MSADSNAPSQASDHSSPFSTEANVLRELLAKAALSQRAAARLLNVEERTMRYWCAGQVQPPGWVFRALSPRLTHAENLRRMIESNEKTITALEDGRVTGVGFGPGISDPASAAKEIERLQKRNEEHHALLRLDEAIRRKQDAYSRLNLQWRPHGSGLPIEENISEVDAAEAEFRRAQAEVDRITQEIRTGRR